jgi:hypothetical protein
MLRREFTPQLTGSLGDGTPLSRPSSGAQLDGKRGANTPNPGGDVVVVTTAG